MTEVPEERRSWHIEKGIPLALLIAILGQTALAGWWVSSVDSRLGVLERQIAAAPAQGDTIIRLDERVRVLQNDVTEIKRIIQQYPPAGPVRRSGG